MNLRIFELERFQSLYENTVPYNLTESGFHPFTLKELLSTAEIEALTDTVLGYGQTNGSILLRKRIAALYKGYNEDNVLVTNGSSEANFVACHSLLKKGDEVVIMVPNYMQVWGIAEEMGCLPKAFHLIEKNGWSVDLDELQSQVSSKAKMITVCNPNNPTGYILTDLEMKEIVRIAERVGAWILADEIYRGAELSGEETKSFIGMYDKVLVNGGLSKAYALPGLRLGWLAGDIKTIADAWAYHDYTSITAGILSHTVGEIALRPEMRTKIFDRNRSMLRENLKIVEEWISKYRHIIRFTPPQGGGMAFMHYSLDINSTDLSDWLRKEKGIFIVAGDWYGMDNYVRIGIGAEKEYLLAGIDILTKALQERFGV
ncbi:MAG: aminotransferase class I/II-fold pyridoxal phosphate-dependent enzyme [Bacteroidia bacterium]|nr:aminotransferase class I/II-fold pyridoxal phosphate-dependent enzyme [Bacteroidia bacterium]